MENILEKIYKASLKLLVPSTPVETYKIIVNEAIKLVNADHGVIHLQEKDFRVVYASHPNLYQVKPRKKANIYKTFISQKPRIADISDVGKAHPEVQKLDIRSSIFIPLSYQHKSIGVLTINTRRKEFFGQKEMKMLVLFGSMVSLAIKKAQLYDEIKKTLEIRDLFISLAAHELRTPLTALSGYIQLLCSKLAGVDPVKSRWAEQALLESQRLTKLINELLQINKIKTMELHYFFNESDLKLIIKRAIDNFKFNYSDRNVDFIDEVKNKPAIIIGDFDKLLQVITNLLDNAAKFSPKDKKIILKLQKVGSNFILQVKDEGVGIVSEDLPKIFEGFYKGDKYKEGMGLGLYLAKNIIDRHRGLISISSDRDKGTTVEILLPEKRIGL